MTIIQGAAGTGKSFLIKQMVNTVTDVHGSSAILLMAPTGVAANNIGGQTIHSALRITQSYGALSELVGESERNFQDFMSSVKVIIIDEMSMIGTRLLSAIDCRLRQAYPSLQDTEFGGIILYLLGDFNQLPPVKDRSMLSEPIKSDISSLRGRMLFEKFTSVFELTQIMRQDGYGQERFRDTLCRLAEGFTSSADYEYLSTRFAVNNTARMCEFKDAIRIMAKKQDIFNYNRDRLRSLDKPVAIINAIHNNITAKRCSEDEAQGLNAELQLAVGCRVMLKCNLWTSKGLCNGSIGTVTDIVYRPSRSDVYFDDIPICVMMKFDSYAGPTIYNGLLPIVPLKVTFKKGNVSCSRTQFPLQLAHGITAHKAQSITVEKAVVDIGDKEFSLGLTYVAMSRVKTIEGLLIDPAFPSDRLLKGINHNASFPQKRKEMARLRRLASAHY